MERLVRGDHVIPKVTLGVFLTTEIPVRLLDYIEIRNFKRFADLQRIELDHPTVLIGPNNCGKTSTIQAVALWSQAVRTWYESRKESKAKERTAIALNRLALVAVPVPSTRFFWHNAAVRQGTQNVSLTISLGINFKGQTQSLSMQFRNQGDEIVYCGPVAEDLDKTDLIEYAAGLNIELLYSMSGMDSEEAILQPGRINVLLGQGQTAQVLRNLCLMVYEQSADDWQRIRQLMKRLFSVELGLPIRTARGAIELKYEQSDMKDPLEVALAGRGFQQLLLIFAYLFSHKNSVLLIDEPDAHLEILRQKQVYVLLRDIASENKSQVILVTHSEVILEESLDKNLTLLLDAKADNLAQKSSIKNALKHFGAEHYVRARERGYVLYVEGGTDIDMLRAFAEKINHPVATEWDERINSFYVQDNYPEESVESELERVEGGFGITPRQHFFQLRSMIPELKGLAILDNDGRTRVPSNEGGLQTMYWKRYEAENYFITPELLRAFALRHYADATLFGGHQKEIQDVLHQLNVERVFAGSEADCATYEQLTGEAKRLVWESRTQQLKLSDFAEEFFRRLAAEIGDHMLLTKGELHRLMELVSAEQLASEISEKLDALQQIFASAEFQSLQ
ncbi:MAG: AAA family ATPase [Planctomycetaceae bacterium]|nr:AAA family ATPase [Planctomycetaceae bacterium]MCA9084694.1 AAA family ATPase [Planctomycetaceae bacterium]